MRRHDWWTAETEGWLVEHVHRQDLDCTAPLHDRYRADWLQIETSTRVILAFVFVQWEEAETYHPSLYRVYDLKQKWRPHKLYCQMSFITWNSVLRKICRHGRQAGKRVLFPPCKGTQRFWQRLSERRFERRVKTSWKSLSSGKANLKTNS